MFNSLIKKELDLLESEIALIIPKEPKEVYGMLVPYIKLGGKRIRPALSILTSLAFNGHIKDVLRPAAIIELFHNFTLIHDDIEDNSLLRRGEPTLHISHGIPIALNSGDALYTLIWIEIINLDLPVTKLIELQKRYVVTFKRLVEGQGIELSWHRQRIFSLGENEYLSMISGKTSALMGLSCELGAFIAGKDKKTQEELRNFGECIGMAFQIQDDVLNLTGNLDEYKKEIGGDITEGKRTLLVIHALSNADESDRSFILSCLNSNTSDQDKIKKCIQLLSKYGSIDYARKKAELLVNEAKKHLFCLPPSKFRDELFKISDFVVSRKS